MDWHWNIGIKCLLFSSFEIHHSTTTTQSKSSSRMWWSSQWWPSYWWKQEKAIRQYWILVSWDEEGLRQCSALVDWKWKSRKGFNVAWIRTILINSCTFEQFKDNQEVQSCIARQCIVTRRFYRVYLSRRKRKRIEVNSEPWFDSRRSQFQNGQTLCILHHCEFDG